MRVVEFTDRQVSYLKVLLKDKITLLEQNIRIAIGRTRTRGQRSESIRRKERLLAEYEDMLRKLSE